MSVGEHDRKEPTGKALAFLSLAALGVVYGDIGTSPLYAIKEAFKPESGLTPNVDNIFGLLSLIVWSLVLIVSVKYVAFILKADNRGEGGVLALRVAKVHVTAGDLHEHADDEARIVAVVVDAADVHEVIEG